MLYQASSFIVKSTTKSNILELTRKMKDLKLSLIFWSFSRYHFQSANGLRKEAETSVKT